VRREFVMSEEDTFSGKDEKNSGVAGNGNAPVLVDALCPEARDDLMRYGIVELVSVSVEAVPDPERPEDHLAMKISAYVGDNFRGGIRDIDRDLDRVDAISSSSEDDLTLVLRDELLVTLDQRRMELAGLREDCLGNSPPPYMSNPEFARMIRGSLENPAIDAHVWTVGWCIAEEDDGTLLVYCDAPMIAESVDEDSWVRIQDRIRRVNHIIGGIVSRLLGEA
jgi:hypothetical protein